VGENLKTKILYFSVNMLEWTHRKIEAHVRQVLKPDNPINTDFLFRQQRGDGFAVTLCYDDESKLGHEIAWNWGCPFCTPDDDCTAEKEEMYDEECKKYRRKED